MKAEQANSSLTNQVAHYFSRIQKLGAINAELLEALEDATVDIETIISGCEEAAPYHDPATLERAHATIAKAKETAR